MIGFHLSVSKNDITNLFERMKFIKCKICQIFLGNPRSLKINLLNRNTIDLYKNHIKKNGYTLYVHAPYSYNLLGGKTTAISIKLSISNIRDMDKIGISAYVIHLGSTTNRDRKLIDRYIIMNLRKIVKKLPNSPNKCKILIENQSREGNKYLSSVNDIINLWKKISKYPELVKRVGFCIDLCHLYTELNSIDSKKIDIYGSIVKLVENVPVDLIHLNNITAANRDIHAMPYDPSGLISKKIFDNLITFLRIKNINMIVEMSKLYSKAKNAADQKNVLVGWRKFINQTKN